jgi:N-acetylglucosaminyldiphosphoundecaprenol N-acetyl-beta-D-mannosaminyltransferase
MEAQKIALFGLQIDNLTYADLCAHIDARIANRTPGYIVTPNTDHVCRFHRDEDFRDAYTRAHLVLADGVPILWVARWLGMPIREKLSGSDLVPQLSAHAAARGYSVFFFGGSLGTAEKAASQLQSQYPALKVSGTYFPPFGFDKDPEAVAKAVNAVKVAAPDLCFIALGTPKQEVLMRDYCDEMNVPVLIGVGAAFDFVSGRIRRAPRWVQAIGFEWLWRLAQEPGRLWRRYLVEDLLFLRIVWNEFRSRRRGGAE